MHEDDQWLDSGLAETLSDLEPSLPANDLHIIVSRIKDNGEYITKVWFNRKVRRLYVIGLLTEAISMCNSSGSEFVWTSDTPSILQENDELDDEPDDDDTDDDDTAGSFVKI
jgi:hypothetical protein